MRSILHYHQGQDMIRRNTGLYEIILTSTAVLIFGLGIWFGATIASAHADRELHTAVQNAISHTLETSTGALSCKDSEIIQAIKGLAENGAHIKGFSLLLDMDNTVELGGAE